MLLFTFATCHLAIFWAKTRPKKSWKFARSYSIFLIYPTFSLKTSPFLKLVVTFWLTSSLLVRIYLKTYESRWLFRHSLRSCQIWILLTLKLNFGHISVKFVSLCIINFKNWMLVYFLCNCIITFLAKKPWKTSLSNIPLLFLSRKSCPSLMKESHFQANFRF